jgi:uridine kinase
MQPDLEAALALIERARRGRTCIVVGVDGRSGTGKSTWAAALAGALRGTLIDGDSFYAGGTGVRREPPPERVALCLDRPKQRHVIERLRAGASVEYRPFDWLAFDGSLGPAQVHRSSNGIVVLDGVYACHPGLEPLVDVKILLVATDETRAARLQAREGTVGRWEHQWHEAEDWYYRHVMPVERFDLVVDADPPRSTE